MIQNNWTPDFHMKMALREFEKDSVEDTGFYHIIWRPGHEKRCKYQC